VASLHKDPRGKSPYWYCAFTLIDGRRRFKSTKQTDRKDAWDVCRGWEKAIEASGRGTLSEAQARKVLNDILESIGEGPIRTQTTRQYFLNWLTGKELAKKKRTGTRYKKVVSDFLKAIGAKADRPLASLSPTDIELFRDVRTKGGVKGGVSASTIKLDLKLVRSVLSTARRQGLILHNPAEAVDLPLSVSQVRDVFTSQEMRSILAEALGDWKTATFLGYYLGARLGDIISLSWANVDLAGGVISYTQSKTGSRVEIPIHPDLESHLHSMAGDDARGPLCPTLANVPISGRSGLSRQFAAIMAQAGVDQRQVQSSENRKFSALSFHSLRHSFSSDLANAGISADVRMKLTGHKSADVHQRYTHVQLEPLKKAIATLPGLSVKGRAPL
jgi:integrase